MSPQKKEPEESVSGNRLSQTENQKPKTEKKAVQRAKFTEMDRGDLEMRAGNIEGLLDVPMEVTVKLGGTVLSIQELLNVGPGSVMALDNVAGGSVEVLVNNKFFARGEVVVVDENFGVRIISLVSPEELVRKMGE